MARGSTFNLAGGVSLALLNLGLIWLVTRQVGAGLAGVFFGAIALFQVVAIASSLGIDTGLVKWISGRRDAEHYHRSRLLVVAVTPVLVVSGAAGLTVFVAAPLLGEALGGGSLTPAATTIVRWLAPFVPAAALLTVFVGATRGYLTMRPTVVAERLLRPALQLGLAAIAVGLSRDDRALALAWGLPYLIALAVAWVWARRLDRSDPTPRRPARSWRDEIAPFWRFTLPRSLTVTLRVSLQWLDVVIVAMLATPEDAAVYTVATRLLQFGLLTAFSIGQAIEPRLGTALAAGDSDRTRQLFQVSTVWQILLTWPFYIMIALFAEAVLSVFGPEFGGGAAAIAIMTAGVLVGAAAGPVDVLLIMAGKSTWSLANTGAALATNLILNLALIPVLGITGAALAWTVSRLVANLLPLGQVSAALSFRPFGPHWLAAAMLPSVIFGGIGLATRSLLGPDNLLGAILSAGVAMVVYAGALLRYGDRFDLGMVLAMFRPSRSAAG